jgi:hypothetical protein
MAPKLNQVRGIWKMRPELETSTMASGKETGDRNGGEVNQGQCSDARTGWHAWLARRKPNQIWLADWQRETKHRNAWDRSLAAAKTMGNRSHSTGKNEYEEHSSDREKAQKEKRAAQMTYKNQFSYYNPNKISIET